MSYYSNPFKFNITHHAIRRAKERLDLKNYSSERIHEILEEYLEYSTLQKEDSNGKVYKNLEHNITIVVNEFKRIIKTVY